MNEGRDIRRLFDEALARPPSERAAFVTEACGDDTELRARLQALVESADRAHTAEVLPPPVSGTTLGGGTLVGQRIQNYEVLASIGEGGMGVVYRARHLFFPRDAAIKVLHEHLVKDAVTVQRFLNEARAADAIKHPNIIEVYDAGLIPNSTAPYLVLELLRGESLRARLDRQGRLSLVEALEIMGQTMAALGAAHAGGIIHRDLKPENLFLVARGESAEVKVLDFGIAKLHADLVTREIHTATGAVIGTPRYMSPEQCRGHGIIDRRSDVYALGVILYEMLCGGPPFVSEGVGEVIFMHIAQPPVPPRKLNSQIPVPLEAAILKALAKDPNDRWGDMAAFRAALGEGSGSHQPGQVIPAAPVVASAGPAGEASAAARSNQSTLEGAAKQAVTSARPTRRPMMTVGVLAAVALAAMFAFGRRALEVSPLPPGGTDLAPRAVLAPDASADIAPVTDALTDTTIHRDGGASDARAASTKKRKRVTYEPAPW